ncbi:MAG: hypothetical protein ACJAXK_003126 [Yoonia sp.]
MNFEKLHRVRSFLIWVTVITITVVPIVASFWSPLLAWRDPIYIVAGLAGIAAMALLFVQPLLAGSCLPGLNSAQSVRIHKIVGSLLVIMVVIHVAGLWITSPPDVVDALLFTSPTPFSAWGVIAMWAVFISTLSFVLRRRLKLSPSIWKRVHRGLAAVIVGGTIVHALLIVGTMEIVSKGLLCFFIVVIIVRQAYRTNVSRRQRE